MNVMDYASVAPTGGSQPQQGKRELDRDAFMRLLTTQLQSQDPLSPTDNGEFVAQLSQFTSLERMEQVARSVEMMAVGLSANTSAQMVSFVGRQVEARTDKVVVNAQGQPSATRWEVKGQAASVDVEIRDASGKIVRTMSPSAPFDGVHTLGWDGLNDSGGPCEAGTYTVSFIAKDAAGKSLPTELKSTLEVQGVHYASGVPKLELEGGVQVGVGDILWAGQPQPQSQSSSGKESTL